MKRGFYSLLICAIVVAGFSVTSARAQGYGDRNRAGGGGTYNVFVKVLLPDGKPAVGAKLSFSAADYSGPNTGITDSEGGHTFSGLPGGNYTFAARLEGLPQENEFLTISRDTSGGSSFTVVLYFRNPGQKKGDFYSGNPMFKDISKEALEKFKKGMEKLGKNDYKGSLSLFDEAIGLYPQFAPAYYEKGVAYIKLAEYDKAIASFVKAIEIKPDYTEAKYSIGYTHYLLKNYEVAAAVFGDILQTKKDMPEVFMYLGICLVHMNRIDHAETALKMAIATKGGENLALAHRSLAGVYIQKKKNAEAAAELEKYLELVPKAPDADKLKQTISELKKQG
jgi:Tfp pilus assembly protein PilF